MGDKKEQERELKKGMNIDAFATIRLTLGNVGILMERDPGEIKSYFEDKYGLKEEQTRELSNKIKKDMY